MDLFKQIIRFILVGTVAALVQLSALYFLVDFLNWHPLNANILAFILAFVVSYSGHQFWTFGSIKTRNREALWRFFIVAISSFLLNQSLFYIFLIHFHVYYLWALIIVLMIVPPITFILSKLWAFRLRVDL